MCPSPSPLCPRRVRSCLNSDRKGSRDPEIQHHRNRDPKHIQHLFIFKSIILKSNVSLSTLHQHILYISQHNSGLIQPLQHRLILGGLCMLLSSETFRTIALWPAHGISISQVYLLCGSCSLCAERAGHALQEYWAVLCALVCHHCIGMRNNGTLQWYIPLCSLIAAIHIPCMHRNNSLYH